MRRLDDYDAMEPIGCIKIDVEGHEDAVLRGGRRLLFRDHPSLIVEIEERHKRHSVSSAADARTALGLTSSRATTTSIPSSSARRYPLLDRGNT